ncbi:MAG TPA: hypothetical protein VGS22_15555 [Thermoanaerobaculia bacterium]|jgi:hypothetical protein|nr:hypothetical protein [Thermoanaerobaculia bacterium]
MAASGNSNAERVSRWDTLVNNLEPQIADLPHLSNTLAELKAVLIEARDLTYKQDDLRAAAQNNNADLGELVKRGDKIRGRLGAGLQFNYGFTSEMLLKYGFRPRRPPVRKKKEETQPPANLP